MKGTDVVRCIAICLAVPGTSTVLVVMNPVRSSDIRNRRNGQGSAHGIPTS